MSKYDQRPVRYLARKPFKCDNCMSLEPAGSRRCTMGQFNACRKCEDWLADRYLKWVEAERQRKRKLTPEQAQKIRDLYGTGLYTQAQLAEQFNSNGSTINAVIHGRAYQDAV